MPPGEGGAPGESFGLHTDADIAGGVLRAATLIVFLSDGFGGGQTVFPRVSLSRGGALPPLQKLAAAGGAALLLKQLDSLAQYCAPTSSALRITPRKGAGLLFFSVHPDGSPDLDAVHGGCPPTGGVKWIAQQWWACLAAAKPAAAVALATTAPSSRHPFCLLLPPCQSHALDCRPQLTSSNGRHGGPVGFRSRVYTPPRDSGARPAKQIRMGGQSRAAQWMRKTSRPLEEASALRHRCRSKCLGGCENSWALLACRRKRLSDTTFTGPLLARRPPGTTNWSGSRHIWGGGTGEGCIGLLGARGGTPRWLHKRSSIS